MSMCRRLSPNRGRSVRTYEPGEYCEHQLLEVYCVTMREVCEALPMLVIHPANIPQTVLINSVAMRA